MSYSFQGKAKRCRMEKRAISMQSSMLGMPILMSAVAIWWEDLMVPEEVRKEMRSYGWRIGQLGDECEEGMEGVTDCLPEG